MSARSLGRRDARRLVVTHLIGTPLERLQQKHSRWTIPLNLVVCRKPRRFLSLTESGSLPVGRPMRRETDNSCLRRRISRGPVSILEDTQDVRLVAFLMWEVSYGAGV
jgi:hypothetical protein